MSIEIDSKKEVYTCILCTTMEGRKAEALLGEERTGEVIDGLEVFDDSEEGDFSEEKVGSIHYCQKDNSGRFVLRI